MLECALDYGSEKMSRFWYLRGDLGCAPAYGAVLEGLWLFVGLGGSELAKLAGSAKELLTPPCGKAVLRSRKIPCISVQ